MSDEKQRVYYKEINVIRGFTIICVFVLHSNIYGMLQAWGLFVVPCFFFISGLVLAIRYKDGLNVKSFYKRRFRYLLPAYFFWATWIFIVRDGIFNLQSFFNILTGFLVWDMWFLFVLFQFYLLFPLLLKICKKINGKLIFGIYFSFVSLLYIFQYVFDFLLSQIRVIVFQNGTLKISMERFLWFIPFLIYFLMGMLIGLNYTQFKEKLIKYKTIIVTFWIISFSTLPFLVSLQDTITFEFHNIWL